MSYNLHNDKLIIKHSGLLTSADRVIQLGHRPITLWMTGLSASGKSTLAYAIESKLYEHDIKSFVLDGDNVRHGINKDLGFSEVDRSENIRRVAEIASLMNDAGLVVITALISPSSKDRSLAKQIVGEDRFIEVYVNTPIETCEARDPKMLYKKARAGELGNFTGISSPYELPENPYVSIDTSNTSADEAVRKLTKAILPKLIIEKMKAMP